MITSFTGIMASTAELVVWSMNEVIMTVASRPPLTLGKVPDEKTSCNNNDLLKLTVSYQ